MKNFAEINRASIGAKKTNQLFEKLWEHSRTLKRVGLVLVMCLISITQMWAYPAFYLLGNYTGNNWTSSTTDYHILGWYNVDNSESGKYYVDVYADGSSQHFRLYSNNHYGPIGARELPSGGEQGGYNGSTSSSWYLESPVAGIIRICIDQSNNDKLWNPHVWVERPTVQMRHTWGGGSWSNKSMWDRANGKYTLVARYSKGNDINVGSNNLGSNGCNDPEKNFKSTGAGAYYETDDPSDNDYCLFTFDANGYKTKDSPNNNKGTLNVRKVKIALAVSPSGKGTFNQSSPMNVGDTGDGKSVTVTPSTGYHFVSWASTDEVYLSTTSDATTTVTTSTASGTVTATVAPDVYTITYKDGGNVAFTGAHMPDYPTSHTYGTATTLKKASKAGYVFGGWYTNKECTSSAVTSLGATAYTSNITLYAKWTAMSMANMVNNTVYKAENMVPDGLTITTTEYYRAGVSSDQRFNLLGTGTNGKDNTTGPMGAKDVDDATFGGATFSNCLYFKGAAASASAGGSTAPTGRAVQFKIPANGKLDIWTNKKISKIYLQKSSTASVQLNSSDASGNTLTTKDVTSGTYYLYATEGSTTLFGLRFRQQYAVTYSPITNATKTAGGTTICHGDAFTATFTANEHYTLPSDVTVTIGGVAQTKGTGYTWTISDGVGTLSIAAAKVTGAINVSFDAVADSYTVTHTTSNVTKTSCPTSATYNTNYVATYTEVSEYALPETIGVTIGGTPATLTTDYTWSILESVGTLTIFGTKITDDIVVTVNGVSQCSATTPGSISKGTASEGTGTITLTAAGSAATNNTWYWQSAVDGTATNLGSGATKDVNAAGTYYLRSYCSIGGGCWSDAVWVTVSAADLLTIPTASMENGAYTVGGSALNLSSLLTNNSPGSVTYTVTSAGTTDASIDGSSFTATAAGTATVQASIAATGNWAAKNVTATITVSAYSGSSSINIEKHVLDNSKSNTSLAALKTALTSANIEYALTPAEGKKIELDSLDDGKKDCKRNENYLGLKIKNSGSYVQMNLPAGETLNVKFGYIDDSVKVFIDETEIKPSPIKSNKSSVSTIYPLPAVAYNRVVKLQTPNDDAVVLRQIMIGEDIKSVTLPAKISLGSTTNGTISVASAKVNVGSTVTVTVTPDSGYELSTLSYKPCSDAVDIDTDTKEFTMPNSNVTINATFVASCSAPGVLSVVPNTGHNGAGSYQYGDDIILTASCADGTDASTTYAWYKGADWSTAKAAGAIQSAKTAAAGGTTYTKSAELSDAGTYWCEASNGSGCETHNLLGTDISVGKAAFTPDLNYESLPIPVGSTRDPVLTDVPDGAGAATYTSSDTDVAEVDSETGVVTAKAAGSATIRVDIAASANYIARYDTKLISVREAVLYTVTFNPNGGTIDESSDPVEMTQATEGEALTMPTPEHATYTFDGWYIADTEIGDEGVYTPTKNVTAYAKWIEECSGGSGSVYTYDFEASDYLATYFDVELGGNEVAANHTYSVAATNPDKTNIKVEDLTGGGAKMLTGSIKNASGTTITYTTKTSYTAIDSITFYENANDGSTNLYIFKVINGSGEAIYTSSSMSHSGSNNTWSAKRKVDLSSSPKTGKIQLYVLAPSSGKSYGVDNIKIYYGGSSSDCYRVNYHSNGADGGLTFDPLAYDEGDLATVVANGFTFEHETEFIGWNTAVDGSGTMYRAGDKLSISDDDIDLYAQWMPINRFQATEDRYWNNEDNWSHGVLPSASHKVIIEKHCELRKVYLINPIAKVKSVVIDKYGDNTGQLTIVGPAGLAVEEMIMTKNADGDLVGTSTTDLNIDSSSDHENGALAVKGYTEAGDVDLKATVTPKTKARVFGWSVAGEYIGFYVNQFIGTPMLDAKGSDYYGSWLYRWDATAPEDGPDAGKGDWVYASGALAPFQGYTLLFDNHDETYLWLRGTLVYSEDHTFDLAYDARHENLAGTETMLANSYLAPIDVTTMTTTDFAGGDEDKMEATIYVFNSGTPNNWSENEEKGKGNIGELPGQFLCMSINSAEYTGGITEISSMQAFSVYAKSTGATFNLDYERMVYNPLKNRVTGIAPMRAPSNKAAANDNAPDVMKIMVECEHGADKLFMLTREDFNAGFDNGWDARKMFGETFAPQLYAFTPDGNMSVNCVPDEEGAVIGFRKGSADDVYTFSFTYNGEKMLYLNDTKEQLSTLINDDAEYTFVSETGDTEARFIISETPYNAPTVTTGFDGINAEQKAKVHKVLINDHIYIIRGGRMYDATGKMLK